ncbi:MAG: DUF922 domain-containing protein [Pseudomonadota bacterium]
MMIRSLVTFAAFFLCAAAATDISDVRAEVRIDIKTEYYTVRGRTVEALDESISRNAPILNGDAQALGQARLQFKSNVQGVTENGKCRVTNPGVDLAVVVVLPRWRDEKRSGQDLRLLWRSFSGYIAAHEARHVEIARKHAERLKRMFTRVPDAPTCDMLQSRLEAGAKRILSEHHREQLRFDEVEQRRMARAIRRSLTRR